MSLIPETTYNDLSAVCMIGNLSDGYRIVGPFRSMDAAAEWSDEQGLSSLECWIASLEAPYFPNLTPS